MTTTAVEIRESHALATVCLGRWQKGRAAVADRLARLGLVVTPVIDLTDALDALGTGAFALCVVDLEDEPTAAPWIRAIRAQHPGMPIVGITDASQPIGAATALNAGASDLLIWPFHEADVASMVANLSDRAAGAENESPGDALIAQSAAMRQVAELARAASDRSDSVWISGEPGSGRETVARAIHAGSARADAPFVVVRCADGSPDQADERIFGAEADIDALPAKSRGLDRVGVAGALMRAQGGTLVLRDITAAPARVQAKLARLLRDGEAVLADRRTTTPIDVRLVVIGDDSASTAFSAGQLRRELRDRVGETSIEVPPLRERREDIAVLAAVLLRDLCRALETAPQQFSRAALTVLGALPWTGNGRELRSLVEAMVHAVEGPVIQIEDVLAHARLDAAPRAETAGSLREARARFERDWIGRALMRHQGRVEDAARTLGIQRTNLYRKIRQLNVPRALLVRKS